MATSMNALWFTPLLVLFLALFSAYYGALVSLRYAEVTRETFKYAYKQKFSKFLLKRIPTTVYAIQVAFAGILLSLGWCFGSGPNWFWLLCFGVIVYIVCQFAYSSGRLYPKKTLKWLSPSLAVCLLPLWPFLLLVKYFVRPKYANINPVDAWVQIRYLGEDKLYLSKQIRSLLENTLHMQEQDVSDVLLPRNQVEFLDVNDTVEQNVKKAKVFGHTRLPLCEGTLDRCVGFIHIKDLFIHKNTKDLEDLRPLAHPALRFPHHMPLETVLQKLLHESVHMGLVVNEFGSTQGLVTLDRVLEVLVGDIQDEFDEDDRSIVALPKDGTYRVAGHTPLREINERFELDLNNPEVSTIGGLVTAHFGCIPEVGAVTMFSGLRVKVEKAEPTHLVSLLVKKL